MLTLPVLHYKHFMHSIKILLLAKYMQFTQLEQRIQRDLRAYPCLQGIQRKKTDIGEEIQAQTCQDKSAM